MIYLIGGVPRSGKSKLCEKLIKELGCEGYSGDALTYGFYYGMPEMGINPENKEVTEEKMFPFLKGLIQIYVEYNGSMIIEGEVLTARTIRKFMDIFPNDVQGVIMGYSTISFQEKYDNIVRYAYDIDWLVSHYDDDFIRNIVHEYISKSQEVEKVCHELSVPYFDTSDKFYDAIDKVFSYLMHIS